MKTATLPAFRRCLRGFSDARLAAVLEAIRAADAAYGESAPARGDWGCA